MTAERIAIVTGASRGIGNRIARRLGADGFVIGVHYGQSEVAAGQTVLDIEAGGGKAFAFGAVLGGPDGAERFYATLDAALGQRFGSPRFDVLVNNAGVSPFGSVASTATAVFDEVFDVNVRSVFFIAQGAIGRLRDDGRIVNLSSTLARVTVSRTAAYSMSKAAINVLTRLLAVDLGPRRICVNSVSPGVTATDMSRGLLADTAVAQATARANAIPRIGQPDDIADVVAFLAGPDSRWITGQVIEVSGGSKL